MNDDHDEHYVSPFHLCVYSLPDLASLAVTATFDFGCGKIFLESEGEHLVLIGL